MTERQRLAAQIDRRGIRELRSFNRPPSLCVVVGAK